MNSRARLILLAGLLAAMMTLTACASNSEKEAASSATTTATERKPWDQERMTELTGELVTALREVRRAWRREPAFRDTANPNRSAALQLDQRLRDLDRRATQLHSRVKGGDGAEETLNIARNIRVLLNDIDVAGRRIMSSAWMEERVRPAMALLNEIAPYYGSDALFDTETLQRTDRAPRNR
jgi:TolA-binding protein